MIVTHKTKIDLDTGWQGTPICAVQGDTSRVLEATLMERGAAWTVPTEAAVQVRYRKPDGTGGVYDALPDGTQAWSVSENVVTVALAPQMLAVAGTVTMQVAIVKGEEVLSSFSVSLRVQPDPSREAVESKDYFSLRQWLGENAVVYSAAQTLTDGQKVQARDNIGAASAATANTALDAAKQAMHAATVTGSGARTVSYAELQAKAASGEIVGDYVHLSDKVPTIADLEQGFQVLFTFEMSADNGVGSGVTQGFVNEIPPKSLDDADVYSTMFEFIDGILLVMGGLFIIVPADNMTSGDVTFPKKGVWVYSFVTSLRINGYSFDEHFAYEEQGTGTQTDTLTWDGVVDGSVTTDTLTENSIRTNFVRVSDSVPTLEELGSDIRCNALIGSTVSTNIVLIPTQSDNTIVMIPDGDTDTLVIVALTDNAVYVWADGTSITFPKAGVYFINASVVGTEQRIYTTSLYASGYVFHIPGPVTEVLKPEYLPMDAIREEVPTSLPNPNALTINGTDYDGSKKVELTLEAVPDYVVAEAERVAAVVQSRQHANTISFFACSDPHYSTIYNAERQKAAMTHMGQAMGLIRKAVHIDFAAMLGDLIWDYGETTDVALAEVRFVNSCLYEGFGGIPNFRSRGNHDNGYESGSDFTDGQIFANVGIFNSGSVYGDRLNGYCYRDFDDQKLRVICLNSSEGGGCQFTSTQVTWLKSALDLSEKGSGWRTILLSHHPLDWGKSGGANPIDTINAASGIICALHGHIHNFKVDTMTGTEITRISIPNACYSRENQYGEAYGVNWKEDTTYSKTQNSAQDTSFCVITIDLDAKKIYADHYGAGYDRVIAYDDAEVATFAVINTLTNVSSSSTTTSVDEGAAYSATLTADSGYQISSVVVTMGGTDITATAYSGGKISILGVTGDIVITASAVKTTTDSGDYTNMVPISQAVDSTDVFNGIGYLNGAYASSSGTGTDAECVVTGLIPYGYGRTDPLYVKGAAIDTSKSHCRILGFNAAKEPNFQSAAGSAITTYFSVEALADLYYKVTPLADSPDSARNTDYLRFSLIGTGENLIITINEPIE